jgi:hypothetical protein
MRTLGIDVLPTAQYVFTLPFALARLVRGWACQLAGP